MQFTQINSGDYKVKKEEDDDCYMTIITDDGYIVCNTWHVNKNDDWLVTEDMALRQADHSEIVKSCRGEDSG